MFNFSFKVLRLISPSVEAVLILNLNGIPQHYHTLKNS